MLRLSVELYCKCCERQLAPCENSATASDQQCDATNTICKLNKRMIALGLQAHGATRYRCCGHARAASLSELRRAKPGVLLRTSKACAAVSDLPDEARPFPIPPPKEVNSNGEVTAVEDPDATDEIVHDLSVRCRSSPCLHLSSSRVTRRMSIQAAPYEQTLNRSFTLGGLGLHTGQDGKTRNNFTKVH